MKKFRLGSLCLCISNVASSSAANYMSIQPFLPIPIGGKRCKINGNPEPNEESEMDTWPTDVYISLTIAETGVVALSHEMMGWGNSNALEGNIC